MIGDNPELSVWPDPNLTEIKQADCNGLESDPKCKKRIFSLIASSYVSQPHDAPTEHYIHIAEVDCKEKSTPKINQAGHTASLFGFCFFLVYQNSTLICNFNSCQLTSRQNLRQPVEEISSI